MHFLFLFIYIYSCTLKFYCRECFYFVVKCNILCSVWKDEEMDYKILLLFFLILKFLQTLCYRFFSPLRIAWRTFLQHFFQSEVAISAMGRGWMPCNSSPKPGMKSSIVTEFLWGNLFCILIAARFFKLKCRLKIIH